VALGGPDTTTRVATAWQVRTAPLGLPSDELTNAIADLIAAREAGDEDAEAAALQAIKALGEAALCETPLEPLGGSLEPNTGTMAAQADQDADGASDPCRFEPQGGYRRLENRLYRVEVHDGGLRADATFKWSRDNGSLAFSIEEFLTDGGAPATARSIRVRRLGFDAVRSLRRDDWVEIISDDDERAGRAGTLVQITNEPDAAERILELSDDVPIWTLDKHPVVRRWDMPADGGLMQLRTVWQELEDGVQVRFASGPELRFHAGDYWLIPARTNTADVEWPPYPTYPGETMPGAPGQVPPMGVERRRAPLAILVNDGATGLLAAIDQRRLFPAATAQMALFQLGGDGQEPELPDGRLPQPLQVGVANGEEPVEGVLVNFRVVQGDGLLDVAGGGGGGADQVTVPTDADGLASVEWTLDLDEVDHRVEVRLLDRCEEPTHLPVYFNARVDYALHYLSGDGQEGLEGEVLPPLRVWVAHGRRPVEGATVAFTVEEGDGSLSAAEVTTGPDGVAEVEWTLGGAGHRQQVRAQLLTEPGGSAVHAATLHFNANLSLASEVAYEVPCDAFAGRDTVQAALDHHARALSLFPLSGDGQEVMPGGALEPIRVLVASRCGPMGGDGLRVRFAITAGNGTLDGGAGPVEVDVAGDGTATCAWALDHSTPNQAVEATLLAPGGADALPTAPPTTVPFSATLSTARQVAFDPGECRERRGDEWGGVRTVQDALDALCREERAQEAGRADRRPFVPLLVQTLPDLRYRDGRNYFFEHDILQSPLPTPAIVTDGRSVWVGGERGILRIPRDARSNEDAEHIGLESAAACGAFDGRRVWFTLPGESAVLAIDPRGGDRRMIQVPGEFPVGIAFDGNLLWVGDFFSGALTLIDVTSEEVVQVIALDGPVTGLAFDGEFMWVGAVGRSADGASFGRLLRIPGGGGEPQSLFDGDYVPWHLAFDGSHMWATSLVAGKGLQFEKGSESWRPVAKIDSLLLMPPQALPDFPDVHGMVFDGTHMWLLDQVRESAITFDSVRLSRHEIFVATEATIETDDAAPSAPATVAELGFTVRPIDFPERIYKVDVDTNQARGSIPTPPFIYTGAYDGSHLWFTAAANEDGDARGGVMKRLIG
jgi:hypothetical protein